VSHPLRTTGWSLTIPNWFRPDQVLGPNKKVQLINKSSASAAKPLQANIFEDDARARREKRFEREALIERNRAMGSNNPYTVSEKSGGSLGARIQGFTHPSVPWGHVQEPVPDAVSVLSGIQDFETNCLNRMSWIGINIPLLVDRPPSLRIIFA
jgi:hypothetical protein